MIPVWLTRGLARLIRRLHRPRPPLIVRTATVAHALDVPEQLVPGGAVLVARPGFQDWLAFDCPCGTGHRLLMTLSTTRRPHWKMTVGAHDSVTLTPSIDSYSDHGRCHFWLREGRVSWVQPPASPETKATR